LKKVSRGLCHFLHLKKGPMSISSKNPKQA
jgi:hypothetical protein